MRSEVSLVDWTSEPRQLSCRVCGIAGDGELIARVTALAQVDLPAVRCLECGSIDILDEPLDSSPTDASVDGYVEAGVGIGTIAETFGLVDPSAVRRFLDVGCNYGFALDLGRHLFGWQVTGVEPSLAGRRGAEELGLTIVNEYLDADSTVGGGFDLALASEVVEHVPDPVGFLRAISDRLAPEGQVVLTTPAAEIVTPDNPEAVVVAAISPGYHVFLASAVGLETLLRRAGFSHVRVERARETLLAVGSHTPLPARGPSIGLAELEPYYWDAAKRATPGSALATGMIVRYVRAIVARGDFSDADEAVRQLVTMYRARTRIDLSSPRRAARGLARAAVPPWSLAGAAFALGMIELAAHEDNERAAGYFAVSGAAATGWRAAAQVADLDTIDLIFQSAYHRALALARARDPRAESAAVDLDSALAADHPKRVELLAARRCRLFVEIAARGQVPVGGRLEAIADAVAPALARSEDATVRAAAIDALFSLALLHAQRGDAASARTRLEDCREVASETASGAHGESVAEACTEQIDLLPALPRAEVTSHHAIDVFWTDADGTFVDGWVVVDGAEVEEVVVVLGATRVRAESRSRADLLAFHAGLKDASRSGFSAYVPSRVGGSFLLELVTTVGPVTIDVVPPPAALPVVSEPVLRELDDIHYIDGFLADAPDGPALAIGLRAASAEEASRRLARFAPREVTSLDVHHGHGVTVVGDAHRLSDVLPMSHFSFVYSSSVIEHLAMPWLFAAQCARVLRIGGRAYIGAPWTWPTHAEPNDFFRFSERGLAAMFGPGLGFRLVASGEANGVRIIPTPGWRASAPRMPTTITASGAWIVVEKVDDSAALIDWPYSSAARMAEEYPVDGLAGTAAAG